jgi:hypothetical protein
MSELMWRAVITFLRPKIILLHENADERKPLDKTISSDDRMTTESDSNE